MEMESNSNGKWVDQFTMIISNEISCSFLISDGKSFNDEAKYVLRSKQYIVITSQKLFGLCFTN